MAQAGPVPRRLGALAVNQASCSSVKGVANMTRSRICNQGIQNSTTLPKNQKLFFCFK